MIFKVAGTKYLLITFALKLIRPKQKHILEAARYEVVHTERNVNFYSCIFDVKVSNRLMQWESV